MARKKVFFLLLFFIILILIIYGISGVSRSNAWEFKVVDKVDDIEIREYHSVLIAEVNVAGRRKEAIRIGFKKLADYIFGHNSNKEEIGMRAPVLQQNISNFQLWSIRFIMPDNYSMYSLPIPDDPDVNILDLKSTEFLAIKFSGVANGTTIKNNIDKLISFSKERHIDLEGEAILAFYSPPWALPFLKRNEVLIEIKK